MSQQLRLMEQGRAQAKLPLETQRFLRDCLKNGVRRRLAQYCPLWPPEPDFAKNGGGQNARALEFGP